MELALILLFIYILSCVCSQVVFNILLKSIDEYVSRKGYVFNNRGLLPSERRMKSIKNFLVSLWMNFTPIYNLYNLYNYIIKFKDIQKKSFKDFKRDNVIIKKEEMKDENLTFKVLAVKKLKNELNTKNKVNAISELSIDERISILLRELELLYEEKAQAQEIDLSNEIEFLQNPDSESCIRLIKGDEKQWDFGKL